MEIKDPDDVIGVCSDCGSDQPMKAMYNSAFAQEGAAAVCKYCGGVVIITYREIRDQALEQARRERGL